MKISWRWLLLLLLLAPGLPCPPAAAAPPEDPSGPISPEEGQPAGSLPLPFAVLDWTAYAAALGLTFGGTAAYALYSHRQAARSRHDDLGCNDVELLGRHAAALADLYARYGNRFADQSALWIRLAADEEKHGRWVKELLGGILAGQVRLQRERFPTGRIESALSRAHFLAAEAASPDLSSGLALQNALALEEERIAWGLEDAFTASVEQFRKTPLLLDSEIRAHREALSAASGGRRAPGK